MNTQSSGREPDLQQALHKAERLLARHNYPLAKKAFEAVAQLSSDQALREKIQLCDEQILVAERKEAIKRGRRLEKKGKYREALSHFERAAAQQDEVWLNNKIVELRQKQTQAEASGLLSGIDAKCDPEARLAAYEQLLAVDPSAELIEQKAACLVTLHRFDEAVSLYQDHMPLNDHARYFYGYACAKTGAYSIAMEQWSAIGANNRGLIAQIETLLPFLCRELDAKSQGWPTAYAALRTVSDPEQPERFEDDLRYFELRAIEELWRLQAYTDIVGIITPHPANLSLPLLDLYAKVYFRLAEQDIQYLEPAISYWLTAIYNDRLLEALTIKQQMGETLAVDAVRGKLLQRLDELVDRYARAGELSNRTRAFRDVELRVIRQLSELPADQFTEELFPCTPTIALEYSLCQPMLAALEKHRNRTSAPNEVVFETAAFFSAAGPSLMLMESGEDDEALASMPKQSNDDLLNYCRQRVSLAYGLKKAGQGEKRLKQHFSEALPLIKRYQRHQQEIIDLAYQPTIPSHVGLADAMEALSAVIDTRKFREATAFAMGLKAVQLLNQKLSLAPIEKGLKKALAIDPDSELVKNTLADIGFRQQFDAMDKALKKQKPVRAAEIVQRSGEPRLVEVYFNTMERWYQTVQDWGPKRRLSELREFYQGCYLADRQHPLTRRIYNDLKESAHE